MSVVHKRTVSLAAEQAGYVDAQVANGRYASASAVVRAGLTALQERDAVRGWPDDPAFLAECARQARLIRDSETASVRALDEAWHANSDMTGWTI